MDRFAIAHSYMSTSSSNMYPLPSPIPRRSRSLHPTTFLNSLSHTSLDAGSSSTSISQPKRGEIGLMSPWEPSRYVYDPRFPRLSPPKDGSSPISKLPDELWLQVLNCLELDDLLPMRGVNRKLSTLVLSPSLHRNLTLQTLPLNPLPHLLTTYLLPSVRNLRLHPFPFSTSLSNRSQRFFDTFPSSRSSPFTAENSPAARLLALLTALPEDQLITLSLPFSGYLFDEDVGRVLRRIGGKLENLELKGSGLCGSDWVDWIRDVGSKGRGLRTLDLGFTGISALPELDDVDVIFSDSQPTVPLSTAAPINSQQSVSDSVPRLPPWSPRLNPFKYLTSLSLASCPALSIETLSRFLSALPASLVSLNLSHLEQMSFEALWDLRVVHPAAISDLTTDDHGGVNTELQMVPTALKEIKVIGIDCLTKRDIGALKSHWEGQRRSCFPPPPETFMDNDRKIWQATSEAHISTPPKTPEMRYDLMTPIRDRDIPIDTSPYLESPNTINWGTPMSSTSSSNSSSQSPSSPVLLTPQVSTIHRPTPLIGHPFFEGKTHQTTDDAIDGIRSSSPLSSVNGDLPSLKRGIPDIEIEIFHSALLESEDEEGYRRFIGEVVGSNLGVEIGRNGIGGGSNGGPWGFRSYVELDDGF